MVLTTPCPCSLRVTRTSGSRASSPVSYLRCDARLHGMSTAAAAAPLPVLIHTRPPVQVVVVALVRLGSLSVALHLVHLLDHALRVPEGLDRAAASQPRRHSSPRNINVASAASPRLVCGISTSQPRRRRDSSAEYPRPSATRLRNIHVAAAASPRSVHEISAQQEVLLQRRRGAHRRPGADDRVVRESLRRLLAPASEPAIIEGAYTDGLDLAVLREEVQVRRFWGPVDEREPAREPGGEESRRRGGRDVDSPWGGAGRSDAAAATWIVLGGGSQRRRGCDVDSPWGQIAATPRGARRGYSVLSLKILSKFWRNVEASLPSGCVPRGRERVALEERVAEVEDHRPRRRLVERQPGPIHLVSCVR